MASERFYSVPEQPFKSEDINQRMYDMLRERARQDVEFRERLTPKGPTGSSGSISMNGPTGGNTGPSYKK